MLLTNQSVDSFRLTLFCDYQHVGICSVAGGCHTAGRQDQPIRAFSNINRLRLVDIDQLTKEVGEVLIRISSHGSILNREVPLCERDMDAYLLYSVRLIIIIFYREARR